MSQERFINIFIIILIVVIAGITGRFALMKKQTPSAKIDPPQQASIPIALQPPAITNNSAPTPIPIPIPTPPSTASQDVTSKNMDECSLIGNSSFRSINQYEVGLGPNGPTMGYWGISFQENKFEWHHSDVSENGTYTCEGGVLRIKSSGRSIIARYDGNKKILTWDGVEYKKVE